MNRRALFGFLLLNVIVTFVTVIGIISLWTRYGPQPTRQPVAPMQLIITATPDARGTQVVYVTVVVTAAPQNNTTPAVTEVTSLDNTEVADVPTFTPGGPPTNTVEPIPTLDPSLLPASLGTPGTTDTGDGAATANATDANGCQTYALKPGDTAGKIANDFGVTLGDLMRANNLTERDLSRLQIGQVLVIPLNGCGMPTAEPTETPTKFVLPTVPPTATLAPTASNVQVEVTQILSPGDITSEGIELHNISGGVIPMQNWTITDSNGHTFTFPKYNLFPGGKVTIYTRTGTNTPIVLYWGQSRALWGDQSQVITITDSKGTVQTTYPLSGSAAPNTVSGSGGSVPTPTGAAR